MSDKTTDSDIAWQAALAREGERLREARETCDHAAWIFAAAGRCCPRCGTFMVDFGD